MSLSLTDLHEDIRDHLQRLEVGYDDNIAVRLLVDGKIYEVDELRLNVYVDPEGTSKVYSLVAQQSPINESRNHA